MRDVSVSLDRVGDIQKVQGDVEGALLSFEESLGLGRRLLKEFGSTPERMRDVSVSLHRMSTVQPEVDAVALAGLIEEGLQWARDLYERYPTPDSLNLLVVWCDYGSSRLPEKAEVYAAVRDTVLKPPGSSS